MSRFMLFVAALCFVLSTASVADDWPQWRGPQRDGVWRETGIIERFNGERLPAKWRMPIGPGYSGPTVAAGRVFVTDRQISPQQTERVLCFDAATGKSLWTHSYDCAYAKIGYQAGPRACVTVDAERAFAIGAMGHLFCLDVADGRVVWSHDCNREYSIRMPEWGIAGAPLVVGGVVIVHIGGSNGACIVAFDKQTGKEVWRALEDRAQYTPPTLIEQAGKQVVVCWTGDSVAGLSPTTGELFWRVPLKPRNMPIGIATPIIDRDRLFVTSFYDGALMLRLKSDEVGVEQLWRRVGSSEQKTDALQSIISTPVFQDDHIYGVDSYGELRCINATTGDRVWEDLSATPKIRWGTIHFVRQGDRWWMFNERGELIIAKLSPRGFEPLSRAKLIDPTTDQLPRRDGVCWSHPAYANRHIFIRNDRELLSASLAAE